MTVRNFGTETVISVQVLKAFIYKAKQIGFAASDTKTTLTDQSSVYSYRPFNEAPFRGLIYNDTYCGNTVEGGREWVSVDLVPRWCNSYYGGTRAPYWTPARSHATSADAVTAVLAEARDRFPEVVAAFLKLALMELPAAFPVRGPEDFSRPAVTFEGNEYRGTWVYSNKWDGRGLFRTEDPFASFTGEEWIHLNGAPVYWHGYHGGLIRDKYFPLTVAD